MKAIVFEKHGDPSVLEFQEVAELCFARTMCWCVCGLVL